MWEDLSFKDRSKLIELGASQGILDLSTIKHLYNINADGGYLKWKKEIAKHKGIDIDNDNTYNYQAFFEEDPQRAWDMLKKDSKAHFTDKYKTVWHPTFSDESVYSGHKSKYNPQGLVGGHWEGNTFKMSDSLYNSPVSMDDRQQYLIDNEPNGTSLLESNGTLPVYDGIPWGGVLPEVTITPQYSDGGSIHIAKNKRGTFKAQASRMGMSTQQAASHILANKDDYSPAMVKKAVFAHNFAHTYGGKMYDDGGVTSSNGQYHVNPTDYLDVLSNVENNKPVEVTLPDVTVKAADPKNYRSSYDPNGFMDFMNAVTLGVGNRFSVSQDARLVKDIYDATTGNKSWEDVVNSAVLGNEGIFDNPYANMALDIVVPTVGGKYRSIANVGKGIANTTAKGVQEVSYALGRYAPSNVKDFIRGKIISKELDKLNPRPNISTPTPIIRTKAGDVEVDDPNLFYHLDRGDSDGAFSSNGAHVDNGMLYPGKSKDVSQTSYSWWNKGKPYAYSVGEEPLTRMVTSSENPSLIKVRDQNYPIGQWNGKSGFVLNSEYVSSSPIDVSNSTYVFDPSYGWRKSDLSSSTIDWNNAVFAHADGGSLKSNEDNLLAPIIKYYEDTSPSLSIKDQNTFAKGGQMKKARQAVDYFVNKGLTREQAAGLIGNLMRESGMNIAATNPNSGAYGLGQWLGNRKTRLFRRYGYHPTFEQQLDYVWDELNTSHRRGLQMLRASKTVNDAARNAFGYYEFSAGPEAAIRAMNSSGKNTKWKNPNGTYALNSGIKNAQMIFGEVPVTMNNAGNTLTLDTPESTPNIQPIISDDYVPVTSANLKELPTFGQEEDNDSSISSFGPQYLAQNLDRLGMTNPLNPFEKGYQLQSPKAIYANMQGLI